MIKIKNIILYIILIGFSVGIIEFFYSKVVLFIITFLLGIYTIYRFKRFDKVIFYALLYFTMIQILAMARFDEFTIDRLLSFGQFLTRILLAYFIIKIGGREFLNNFERFSFILITIGLPIFFLIQFFPGSVAWLENLDINSIKIQKANGGWNTFFYVHNAWAGFRFCGYSYEPGGMAMMIIIGLMIYILRDGINLNLKLVIYCLALIFTFSTAGYIALFFLVLFYFLNQIKKRFLLINLVVLFLVGFYVIPFVWRQEFMQGKLSTYIKGHKNIVASEQSYSGIRYRNVGRISAAYVYLANTFKWPIGHGTTTNGRIKNIKGDIVVGANSVFGFLVNWGILGFIFYLNIMLNYFRGLSYCFHLKHSWFLIFPFLIVFASNSMLDAPLFYIFPIYSLIFLSKKNWYKKTADIYSSNLNYS